MRNRNHNRKEKFTNCKRDETHSIDRLLHRPFFLIETTCDKNGLRLANCQTTIVAAFWTTNI